MNNQNSQMSCDPTALMEALMRSAKRLEASLDAALAEVGLSSAKWATLKSLVEAGESLPLGQLAERLDCVKSNATQMIDRLEAEDLVRRTLDPADRRVIRAEVTAEGKRRYELGLEVMRRAEREMLGDQTAEEHRTLNRLLNNLAAQHV